MGQSKAWGSIFSMRCSGGEAPRTRKFFKVLIYFLRNSRKFLRKKRWFSINCCNKLGFSTIFGKKYLFSKRNLKKNEDLQKISKKKWGFKEIFEENGDFQLNFEGKWGFSKIFLKNTEDFKEILKENEQFQAILKDLKRVLKRIKENEKDLKQIQGFQENFEEKWRFWRKFWRKMRIFQENFDEIWLKSLWQTLFYLQKISITLHLWRGLGGQMHFLLFLGGGLGVGVWINHWGTDTLLLFWKSSKMWISLRFFIWCKFRWNYRQVEQVKIYKFSMSSGETTTLGPVLRKIFVFWDLSVLTPDLESAQSILPESR